MSPVDYSSPFNSQKWLTRKYVLTITICYLANRYGEKTSLSARGNSIVLTPNSLVQYTRNCIAVRNEKYRTERVKQSKHDLRFLSLQYSLVQCFYLLFSFLLISTPGKSKSNLDHFWKCVLYEEDIETMHVSVWRNIYKRFIVSDLVDIN